ncbi:hypothetical protein I4U23_030036 [Adineta vaga]|nr:hypothetical protein I4U23_030036 [Adineta vaga]
MATNNDLDDFFKKKDRKVNKNKKQTGLLTNNEELLKQLVIVTSATSAFKENLDFDDDDDEETVTNNHNRHHHIDATNGVLENKEISHPVMNKSQSNSTSTNSKTKNTTKLSVQDINNEQQTGVGQQDEWEEFEDSNSKYQQLRLKISRATHEQNNGDEDDDNDDYYDDGHNHDGNTDENLAGEDGDQPSRNNRRREQQKDKPAWKIDQVKIAEPLATTNDTTDSPSEKIEEPVAQPKPATSSSAYRPPALRNNSSVTVVGHINQRPSKKEKPNLASTEEFPSLGAAVNKK